MSSYGDRDTILAKAGLNYESLNLDSEAEYWALIDRLIDELSGMVDVYCDKDFNEHTDDITLDGTGTTLLVAPGFPILTIISLKENGKTLVEGTDFRIQKDTTLYNNSGILEKKNYTVWCRDWDNIELNYTWGFITPPDVIRGFVENLVVALLVRTAGIAQGQGVSAYSMDGFSVTFKTEMGKQIWEENKVILDRLKDLVVV